MVATRLHPLTKPNTEFPLLNTGYHAEVCKLRWILMFGLLAWAALPSGAAKLLTVAQLEQVLAEDAAAHRQDSEIAKQISGIALTERIPQATLARLMPQFR